MNNRKLTPMEMIRMFPPGCGFPAFVSLNGGKMETRLLIREDFEHLSTIKRNPKVEIRVGVITLNNVVLVPLMVRLDEKDELTYEMWLNYHSDEMKQEINSLGKQNNIDILFIGDNFKIDKIIKTGNFMKSFFKDLSNTINKVPKWSMEEFDNAKDSTLNIYPDAIALWNGLGQTNSEEAY